MKKQAYRWCCIEHRRVSGGNNPFIEMPDAGANSLGLTSEQQRGSGDDAEQQRVAATETGDHADQGDRVESFDRVTFEAEDGDGGGTCREEQRGQADGAGGRVDREEPGKKDDPEGESGQSG